MMMVTHLVCDPNTETCISVAGMGADECTAVGASCGTTVPSLSCTEQGLLECEDGTCVGDLGDCPPSDGDDGDGVNVCDPPCGPGFECVRVEFGTAGGMGDFTMECQPVTGNGNGNGNGGPNCEDKCKALRGDRVAYQACIKRCADQRAAVGTTGMQDIVNGGNGNGGTGNGGTTFLDDMRNKRPR